MVFKFEVVKIDDSTKAQEWLIPWARVGAGMQKPEPGKKIAFIAGYNDVDSGMTDADMLRWKNYCDAYCPRANWGDIEFSPTLEAALSVPVVGPKVIHGGKNAACAANGNFYTLTGRKIRMDKNIHSRVRNNAMVSKRNFEGWIRSVVILSPK
jgi:hypothetical protein